MRAGKLLFVSLAVTAWATPLLALNPGSRISQYGHAAWRVQDGALNGSPTVFAQTPDGYIWVGTESGLYRFDGVSFLPWNPPVGQLYPSGIAGITSLHVAKDGSLWIGTGGGLAHWANGKFSVVAAPNAAVESIAEDRQGTIWITRSHMHEFTGPICKISDNREQCFGKPDGIETIAAGPIATDALGRFWIGGVGTMLEWQGKLIKEHMLPGGPDSDNREVEGVVVDAEGTVWTGEHQKGSGDGLRRFSNGRWEPYAVPGFNGGNVSVDTLFLDTDHCLWIGTTDQGLYRLRGQSVDHFGHEDGLSSNSVNRIFQDREGGIWVATSEGIDHFRDLPIVTYSSLQGVGEDYVAAIMARRDGSVAIASVSSVNSIRGSAIISEKLPPGLQGHPTAMLEDHNGNLWIGGGGGLRVEVDGRWRVVLKDNSVEAVSALAEDTDHAIWAKINGRNARLIRIENFEVREKFEPPNVPAAYFVVADPHGGVWIGSLDGKLMHYQNGEWHELSMEPLARRYSPAPVLFNVSFDADGVLWGTGNRGVIGYRNGNLQLLNERNGLPCSSVYTALSDTHSNLWLSTKCGLMRIQKSELERWWANPESYLQVSTFTASDGFRAGIPLSHPAAVRTADGKLWFHNNSVVMMVDPDHFAANTTIPPVHIAQLVADRKTYAFQNGLRLPPKTHQLEIDYVGLSYVAPSQMQFRYRLEGYDAQWQEPGTRRAAFYNDLPPGHYTFRVIAANNSGLWNTDGASLQFNISPAYYQTNLFRVMCAFIFFALLWGFFQWRIWRMRQEFNIGLDARVNERTRIARELHDTLLQSLHGLMFQFQAARNMLPRSPENAMRTLDEAIAETEQAIAESRDAIHDLRSQSLSEGDLAVLLEVAGAELASAEDANRAAPSFRVIVEGEPRKLAANMQDEVYRIGLELLRNAFRHAEASQIEAEIRYDKNQFRLRIRDNGTGIDPKILDASQRPGHWGLPGARERAERIGSQLSFWSQAGAGTEVELTIPTARAYECARNGRRFKLFRKEPSQ